MNNVSTYFRFLDNHGCVLLTIQNGSSHVDLRFRILHRMNSLSTAEFTLTGEGPDGLSAVRGIRTGCVLECLSTTGEAQEVAFFRGEIVSARLSVDNTQGKASLVAKCRTCVPPSSSQPFSMVGVHSISSAISLMAAACGLSAKFAPGLERLSVLKDIVLTTDTALGGLAMMTRWHNLEFSIRESSLLVLPHGGASSDEPVEISLSDADQYSMPV